MGAAAALLWSLVIVAVCHAVVISQGIRSLVCPRRVVTSSGGSRDWNLRYARCYLAIPEAHVTWEEASRVCQRYGGQLAEPAGFKLTEELGNIATASYPTLTHVWIGYNRRGYTGDMTQGLWGDGKRALADVGVWGYQEPNIQAGECAYMMRGAGTSWTWHLGNCDMDLPFICQTTPCTDDTFRCDNGLCVGQSNVCNGENNCKDGSDERNCSDAKCSYLLTGKQGTLRYPSGSSDYLPSKTCQWVIEGAVGSRLQIQFLSLETEKGVDFVELWVGGSTLSSSTLLHRLSGTNANGLVVSTNNVAIVRFLSDDSYHYKGFSLTWQSDFQCSMVETVGLAADDDEAASSKQVLDATRCGVQCGSDWQCMAYVYNIFTGMCYRYNFMPKPKAADCCTYYVKTCPGYSSMPNLPSLPGEGGDLYASSTLQRFHSPLYPLPYLGDAVTTWLIHSPGRQLVTLHILDLDLAPGDMILVFDGSTTEAPVLATMRGSDISAASLMTSDDKRMLLSTQNMMLVQLTSHQQSNSRGFLFAYKAGCQLELSGSTGRICSPGYQMNLYPNIMQCSWVIQVPSGRTLKLTFDPVFALENGKDFLKITADGFPKHTGSGYTGMVTPPSVLAQNGHLELFMETGATGRARGFSTQFNAGCATVQDSTLAQNKYTANFGESITVQCASEYVFTGIYSNLNQVGIFCQEGGKWNKDPFPTCKRVYCGPPSDINNGYLVSVTGPYSGDTATYDCENGFQLSTKTPIKCRNSGFWDARPFCFSLQSCPTVVDPFQGRSLIIAGNGYDHGSVVNFTCINPLYELQGSANLVCENGKWSGPYPTCKRIPCAVPYVANGTVMPSINVVQGQTLSVVCDPGFILTGSATFNCNETALIPSCVNVDECRSGSGCSQGCIDTVGSYYCTCQTGFQLLSDGRTCSDIDECTLYGGNCDGICINSPGSYRCECIGNSQLFITNGQFGITIPASETGLEPWNIYHLNHTCIQTPTVVCPVPPQSISNGYLLGETGTFTVGQSITYLCNLGYDTKDQTTLTCQSNGNWSSSTPACSVATCPEPVIALGTVTSQTPIRYLDYVTVTCNLLGVTRTKKARCMWDNTLMAYRVDTSLLGCDTTVVDCGIPPRLPGSLPYSLSSTVYSAQFSLICRSPLFKRVGKSSIKGNDMVTCGGDGQWDFGELRCEGPTCPDPGTSAGTKQVATSYEEFSIVRYTCEQSGFEVTSDLPLYCQFDPSTGGLAWNGTAPNCTDKEQPSFSNCPSSVRQVSYLSSAFFAEPVATDNVMVKELTITPNDFTVSTVIQTDIQVAYIARDHAGNIGSCVISLRVRDESPPHIRCNNSFEMQLFSENQFVKYDPVDFVVSRADNTGSIAMTYSVNPLIIDRYSVGEVYTVKIDATDPSGNSDTCLVQVKVKAPLCVPWSLHVDNASITCFQQNNNGYRCDIRCNTGYKFFEDPDAAIVSRYCNPGGDWDQPAPNCTVAFHTNHRLSVQMNYRTRDSPSSTCQSNYISQLNSRLPDLTKSLTSLCAGQATPVTVSTAANVNPVAVTPYNDGIYGTFRLDLSSSPSTQSAINQCVSTVTSAFRAVSNNLQAIRTLSAQSNCAASEVVQFGSVLQNSINCNRNQQSRIEPSTGKFQCVTCIPGYTSNIGSSCSKCSGGSYFDSRTGSCQFCPSGTRSQTIAARHIGDCYLHCPYGYASNTGIAPCTPCPEHTYSLNITYCAPCAVGLFTRGDAQGFKASCRSPCQPGTFSYDGLSPCRPCPKGFYQSQAGASTCTECSSNQTTVSTNSTSVSNCKPAGPIVCSNNPCFKGSCIAINHDYRCLCPAGYTGRNCQTPVGPCDSNPCYNNAICLNKGTDYECRCTETGTAGINCGIDKNDNCAASPCHNFGACQDRVRNHICLCPSFSNYTHSFGKPGGDCIQLRDPCQENPCQNGATCTSLGGIRRKCQCAEGYQGESCETDKAYCASNPCQNGAQCQDGPGSQVICSCLPGYSGTLCEVRQDQCIGNTCGQYSTCVDVYTSGQVQCYCNQGFVNVNGVCQMVVVDACLSSPCENNSTCVRSGAYYQCFCKPGYTGANCQHNIDDCATSPCENGGTCMDLINGFKCICPSDTSGPTCQDAFDQCSTANNPCHRYGTARCNDYYRGYSCECLPGYYGVNCTEGQTNCRSFPCRHGGSCQDYGNSYICQCPDGFQGSNCEIFRDFCSSSPCANGGSCVNTDTGTVCKCKPGYRGDRCEIRYNLCAVANPCVVSGSACITDNNNRISCTNCPQGYSGQYCQNSTTSCRTTTCQNGGTCSDRGGVALCSCPAGFSGKLCEVNNDDCKPSPCPTNSVCVDGINAYSCVCAEDKIGDDCNKDLSLNFDLIIHPGSIYPKSDLFTWPLASTAFTVATWVQFTERTSPGTVLTLFGLNQDSSVLNPQHLVRINRQSAALDFAGTKNLTFSSVIDDGYWHHIVVRWDGSNGQVTMYVDGTISSTLSPYGQGMRLAPFGWIVVGGTYDAVSDTINRSGSMVGRISRLHVSTKWLSDQDVSVMYANTNYVPNGSYRWLTKHLLHGTSATVDYQSKLTQGVCLPSSNCRSLDQVLAHPSVVQCPGNQMTVSQRRSKPSWTTASFLTNDPVSTNYVSGSTEMGWGYYGVAYTQSNSDGDTAVCSFLLDNRRGSCKNPVPPRFGSHSCVTTGAGIRCEVTCNRNYTRSQPEPLFYSCGTYGMFDTTDRVLPFTYPSCTTCEKPKLKMMMELNYTLSSVSNCNSAQSSLTTNIRSSLNTLNTKWQEGLCGSGSCSSVPVILVCPTGQSQVTKVTVDLMPDELLRYNFVLRTVTEVLTIAVVDDNAFTYGNAIPEVMSLVFTQSKSCASGKVLLGECCIECGLGHYYNTETKACIACPRGTYLNELGRSGTSVSSPCRSCPSGLTTANVGAESDSDCADQCQFGSYYNLTEAQCVLCPVGFYAENPGSFFCDDCPYRETTAKEGATASASCSLSPITTTTAATTTNGLPSTGASTAEDVMSWTEVALLVLGLIVLIVLIFLVLFFCFRQHLVKWCPCLVTKVKPEDKTGWHYVDRFGETRLKFASYNLNEMRKSDRDLLEDSVEEGSVHTNISLQVPVFEEKLNGMVKKKSVHVSDRNTEKKKEKRRKKKRARKNADLEGDRAKPEGSAAPPSATELPGDNMMRRPPSAFNRPRPTLEEVPYDNFVSPSIYENVESVSNPPRSPSTGRQTARIMIESDEDER